MEIAHREENGFLVIALRGRLDELSASEAHQVFTSVVPSAPVRVVLDFTGVEYISSGGLRVVLMLLKAVKRNGGALRLCGLNPFVTEVFSISNLLPMFETFATCEQAVASNS